MAGGFTPYFHCTRLVLVSGSLPLSPTLVTLLHVLLSVVALVSLIGSVLDSLRLFMGSALPLQRLLPRLFCHADLHPPAEPLPLMM